MIKQDGSVGQANHPDVRVVVGEHESFLQEDDRIALDALRQEATLTNNPTLSREIESEVTLMGVHLAIQELVQAQADADIRAARAANAKSRRSHEVQSASRETSVDTSKIGWIPGNEEIGVQINHFGEAGEGFWLGSIVDRNRTTAGTFNHLKDEGLADQFMTYLKDRGVPKFLGELKSGRGNLRPVSRGRRKPKAVKAGRSLDTEYPAYKIDVLGTSNRAILMLTGKEESEQIVVLAAMYDHEAQGKIFNSLFAKGANKRS